MKRIIILTVVLSLLINSSLIINVFGKDAYSDEGVTFYFFDSTSDMRRQNFLCRELEMLGIDPDDCSISSEEMMDNHNSEYMNRNDPNDYKTVWSSMSTGYAAGYAAGQPAGGVMITSGGSINYTESGGGNISVSFAFGGEFGSISVSVPIGTKASYVTGYSVNVSSTGYWKLYVTKTYHAWAYRIYKKIWIDDMNGYQWVQISNGVYKELYNINLQPKRIS